MGHVFPNYPFPCVFTVVVNARWPRGRASETSTLWLGMDLHVLHSRGHEPSAQVGGDVAYSFSGE